MYDAIVVGSRCAGSPTAMLLARKGYKVLLVDKASFPSDIMSTHYVHIPGVARLQNWGLLDKVHASNCPPITSITLHMNGLPFTPPPPPVPEGAEAPPAYCPRRTVLDKILVDAAVEAGAELREGFAVRELVRDGDAVAGITGGAVGSSSLVEERAKFVIGADGMHSVVAREVQAPEYNTKPSLSFGYYAYWSNAPGGAEIHFTDDGGALCFPTNDGLTCVAVGGPTDMFPEFRKDIEANYMKIVGKIPLVAKRLGNAKREERFVGTNDQPNFFRKPYGPGWALVGDAGYHRDFITGLGISDAFRDAEYLTDALDEGFSGKRPLDEALRDYEQRRNKIAEPLYDLTIQLVSGDPPQPEQFLAFGAAMAAMMPNGAE
ncbi:MAG: NAD(P)/FAD-dependent oxidoreductase [Dehalococcoidia bacterium]